MPRRHAHELSERPPQKWFFASHHKALLDAILEPIKGLLNPKLSYRLYYSHHIHESVSWSSDVFKYNLIDGQAWARIAHSGHSGSVRFASPWSCAFRYWA